MVRYLVFTLLLLCSFARQTEAQPESILYSDLGESVEYLGHRVVPAEEGVELQIDIRKIDRASAAPTVEFTIQSPMHSQSIGEQVDAAQLSIGAVYTVKERIRFTECPLARYNLHGRMLSPRSGGPEGAWLDSVQLAPGSANLDFLKPWTYIGSDYSVPLAEALKKARARVAVRLPSDIGMATSSSPRPEDIVAIERSIALPPGGSYRLELEMFDSYAPTVRPGKIEQRVYLDGERVFVHDIGDQVKPTYGWVPVSHDFKSGADSVTVRIEVAPLARLGSWGWGEASRTWVRNVSIQAR